MADTPRNDADIEPLSDEALEEVAGGSSGGCCSCDSCSNPPPIREDSL
jgi:hypothetical protein